MKLLRDKILKLLRLLELLFALFLLMGLFGSVKDFNNINFWIGFILLAVMMFLPLVLLHNFLSKKASSPSSEQSEQSSSSVSDIISVDRYSTEYVENENSIQRVDGKLISDEEIPYLIQIGYERVLERESALRSKQTTVKEWQLIEYSRIINDSYKILSETADPDTFCSRFNFIKNKINELNSFCSKEELEDSFPTDDYNALISTKNVRALLFKCHQKYYNKAIRELKTNKGIENRETKFWNIIKTNLDFETLKHLNN